MTRSVSEIAGYVESNRELLVGAADSIWDFAEMAFHESRSAELLADLLEREGFSVERGVAGMETAFVATFGDRGPVIALLGEYDALSGLNQKAGCARKSAAVAGGAGHGCGHHALGAGALGAALAVKRFLEASGLPGTVRYYGCPAEEGGSGKSFMVRDGLFSDVDCALTWHPCDTTGLFSGRSLSNIGATYSFRGMSAHAAGYPHLGRSALDAVELMDIGVNYLREHVIPEARMHYAITDTGGSSPNVVQAQARVFYYLRAPSPEEVAAIKERVDAVARGAALMTGTRLKVEFHKAVASLMPNSTLDDLLYRTMAVLPLPDYDDADRAEAAKYGKTIVGREQSLKELARELGAIEGRELMQHLGEPIYAFIKPRPEKEPLLFGSTDVGDVSMTCPTAQIHAATWAAGTPFHSWQAVAQGKSALSHKGMLYASKVLAIAAASLFENPGLVARAKEELSGRLGGRPFVSLTPADAKPQVTR